MTNAVEGYALSKAEVSAVVTGFGMGGSLDFTLLHLILQWHHMISNRVPPDTLLTLQQNIFWDGIGEALMWGIIFAGILLLLRAAQQNSPMPGLARYSGLFLVGWGAFNLLDGIVNHHIFMLHNVREDVPDKLAWNIGFMLVGGILLPILGWLIAQRGRKTNRL